MGYSGEETLLIQTSRKPPSAAFHGMTTSFSNKEMSMAGLTQKTEMLNLVHGSLLLMQASAAERKTHVPSTFDRRHAFMINDEWNQPEKASRWTWDLELCEWREEARSVKTHKHVFATGNRFGCVLMVDLVDSCIYVLKATHDHFDPTVYDQVRTDTIACQIAEVFNSRNPPMRIEYLSSWVYVLTERPLKPAVRTELLSSSEYAKVKLRDPKGVFTPMERDSAEAFELFSYHQSGNKFVLCNPSRVGDSASASPVHWTAAEYHRFD